MAIPVVPAGSYPGSVLQKERFKKHTTNLTTRTTNNENTETVTQMAQPAATLSLPRLTVAPAFALCTVPTKLDTKAYHDIYP